ncbi:SusC/RagA family TonB-linked outer membrane protein [Paradesertivirga mongoliensis]|uniref:SusC/RagA family TonB-linked outer membrane protein n=1 Tax=Paradesertivirga mongoliensis TaxID=2100740 RepID=A0ABW4ZRW8_9SPHI|nr:SusC/RagA family TonB-linked outer membrane protein [Pedobacter mongoliensis]
MKKKPLHVLIMQITFLQIAISLSLMGSAIAKDSKAQAALKANVSINVKSEKISKVLSSLEQQSDVTFIYSSAIINSDRRVSLSISDKTLENVLDEMLPTLDLSYQVSGDVVLIKRRSKDELEGASVPLVLVKVTGKVTDEAGEVLPGVSVRVEGTNTGTVTDVNGVYSISAPDGSSLVFSYIGFESQTIAATEGTINVVLKIDQVATKLNEVVVVGYGTSRKKDLTGSVISITPDKIANENPGTVQDILRGTPGVSVGMNASAKGGGSIQIRGQRSVYTAGGHNDPMIVLDNVPFYGELSEINPDDIGQIDILKDASAAAVYGSRAANGVIIITTKKGKQGKPVINFTSNFGMVTKSAYRDSFNPDEYMQYREDWYKTPTYGLNTTTGNYEAHRTGTTATKPGFYDRPDRLPQGITLDQWKAYSNNTTGESEWSIYAKRLTLEDAVLNNYLSGKTFDWYDHTFREGFSQDYNTSVSGASDKINYYMSMGYLNNEGAVKGNVYRSVRSNLKVDGKVTDWLEFGANINFQDRSDGDLQPGLGTNYWEANELRNSPYANYRDEAGNLVVFPMGSAVRRGYSYDFDRQYMELEKGFTVLNSIFNAKVKLPFDITYSFNASPRYQYFYDRYFESTEHPEWQPIDRGANREQSKQFNWSINNTLNWERIFAQKHRFNATLMYEAEKLQTWRDRIEARNIQPTDALGFHSVAGASGNAQSSIIAGDERHTANGLLGRVVYSFDDRYNLSASVRRDGYSAFGRSNPYATFPAVGAGWTFTNEKFFKWEPLSYGKLRFSWGRNGNRQLNDPYISFANLVRGGLQGYITTSGTLTDIPYLRIERLANPNLRWEQSEAYNAGLDFGFINGVITGSVEAYHTSTKDMIMNQALPGFSGFSLIGTNLGEVLNRGIEFNLSTRNVRKTNFSWNTDFNFSYNRNEIKHLYYQNEDVLDASGNVIGTKEMDDRGNGWFIGQPISAIWNYRVTGIWQSSEIEEAKRHGQVPGDPKVANNYTADDIKNANGTITPVYNDKDREFLGQTAPPVNWSIRNSFTFYKNIDFSFNIYSYMGHKSLNGNYLNEDNGGSLITYGFNTFKKEYWTPENQTNDYARLDAKGPAGAGSPQKLYNRDFIRLESIAFGYSLPTSLISRWRLNRAKVFGSIRNVGVWNRDWEYGDPETGGLATRTFTMGLNLTL